MALALTRGAPRVCGRSMSTMPFDPTGYHSHGVGGRSSVSGITATLFGATGMLGGYVAQEFGRVGSRAYLPNRGCEMEHRHLKPMFDLGAVAPVLYSTRDEKLLSQMLTKSNVVVNMIGKYYETKHPVPTRRANGELSHVNSSFEEVNIEIPQRLAKIAYESGVDKFIHVSHVAADLESPSRILATKAAGEQAVREAFPGAIIVRPATLFGHEDRFLNWYAQIGSRLPALPLIDGGSALVQPVFAHDVAKAILTIAQADTSEVEGATFELGGASEFSRREIAEFVLDITKQEVFLADLPPRVCEIAASITGMGIWGPLWTPDLVALEQQDLVFNADAPGVLGLSDLGVTPTPIEKIAFSYLHRFRTGGHYVLTQGYH